MKEAHTMSTADLTGTAREYRQLMADIKALEEQAEHADLYAAYTKRTTATRFQVA
jgi:hypothetical protein